MIRTSSPPPAFSIHDAQLIATRHFGITAEAHALTAERDQNFRLRTRDGTRFLLKISNPAEDSAVTDFQTQLMLHIARRDPGLPVPRVVPTVDSGSHAVVTEPAGRACVARVFSWLEGAALTQGQSDERLAAALGAQLARLDRALQGFQHPASDHDFNWDMKRLGRLRTHLCHIDDGDLRGHLGGLLDGFERDVLPRFNTLRHQVIYNDLNPSNILVDANDPTAPRGIVDFGDAVHAPLVIDLAVACAYQLEDAEVPFRHVAAMVQAYHRQLPLNECESALLYPLMRARHVMTVIITHWRAANHPQNRPYIMRNCPQAMAVLRRLRKCDDRRAVDRLREFTVTRRGRA